MARYAAIRGGMVVGVLDAGTSPTTHIPLGMTFANISTLPEVSVGWIYLDGIFSEGPVTQKQQFLTSLQAQMTELALSVEKSQALVSAFVDRGYDAAATDPITDADLVSFGVIVYDLGIAINLMQQLQALSAQPAFEATLSKWRTL